MALRAFTKKGIRSGFTRVLNSVPPRPAAQSFFSSSLEDAVKELTPASVRCISEFSFSSVSGLAHHKVQVVLPLTRCFHASSELWARRTNNELVHENSSNKKIPKKGKFVKRIRTEPPVEAPYVPPKLKRTTRSLVDKTIDIFEGMTIIELAKRAGSWNQR